MSPKFCPLFIVRALNFVVLRVQKLKIIFFREDRYKHSTSVFFQSTNIQSCLLSAHNCNSLRRCSTKVATAIPLTPPTTHRNRRRHQRQTTALSKSTLPPSLKTDCARSTLNFPLKYVVFFFYA